MKQQESITWVSTRKLQMNPCTRQDVQTKIYKDELWEGKDLKFYYPILKVCLSRQQGSGGWERLW